MVGFEEYGQECFHVTQPDPVVLELNRLQNLLKEGSRVGVCT
ncbi:hypothetical protein Hanom_Chr16g01480921 [Helianthus anomalus]